MIADRVQQTQTVILYDKDREKLLNDVLDIKRLGDFKPTYKLASHAHTSQKRPQEFEGGFEEWFLTVREFYRNAEKEKKILQAEREKNGMLFRNHIMGRMMRVS